MNLHLVLGLCLLTIVCGFPFFRDQIPNGKRVPHPCKPNYVWNGVGHENEQGGGTRNPFGVDWELNGKKWDKCLCETDSDGDGRTNGEELGDPDCVWTIGQSPSTTVGLSHPGVCEPIDSAECMDRNAWTIDCSLETFECSEKDAAEDVREMNVRMSSTPVPAKETNYVCQFIELDIPHDQDFHMIASEPYIDNDYVMHHLILYGCPDENEEAAREKFLEPTLCGMETYLCPRLIALWTVGSPGDCLAPEFGVRLGKTGFKYALLEMHWNNPELRDDYEDGSGINLYYTPILRQNDGSTFFTGPAYLELPPGYKEVTQSGRCIGECTSNMFVETVYISAVLPHMHYLGRKMFVEQTRDGERVRIILDEQEYSYDNPHTYEFQPALAIIPGDEIHVTCTFDTSSADDITYFGLATSDEMCLAIIQYYPLQANHSNCYGWENLGYCGEHRFFEENHLTCDASIDSMLDATSEFWLDWYPKMEQQCDDTASECRPGCQDIFDQMADQYVCFEEESFRFFKILIEDYSDTLPSELFHYLASCGSMREDWVALDDDDFPDEPSPIDDSDGSVCVLPPSKGVGMRFSHLLILLGLCLFSIIH